MSTDWGRRGRVVPSNMTQDLTKSAKKKSGPPGRRRKAGGALLTPAQQRFIQGWMVRRNATRAYQDAYPGATYATANANGPRLLRHARVCSSINALLDEERERLST